MKKILTKVLACAMAVTVGGAIFSGCVSGSGGGSGSGKNKIKISVYGGGFGSEWAVKMIGDYNQSSNGKYEFVKIQDYLDNNDTITAKILAGVTQADIFFTDQNDISQLMASGKLLNLKDVWEATPDANGEKIRTKIYEADTMESLWSNAGGIYAIPYTLGVSSQIYDYDLFEDAGWFITDNSTASGYSKGLDGIEGTYDDGLPATEMEYADLLSKILDARMLPYTLMGSVSGGGIEHLRESIHAQYEGLQSYKTSYSYNGKMYIPSTGTTENITPETGYKTLTESEGRNKAIDFISQYVLKANYIDNDSKNSSHTEAEERFLFSHNSGMTQIAMTFNGCWWENEARPAFDSDSTRHGAQYGFGKRRFGIMPTPALNGQNPDSNGKAYYSVNTFGSVFAVKSDDEEKNKAMIDFLTYFASDKGLATFTETVGVIPAYNFKLSENIYNNLTYYGKTYYDMLTAENTVIVMPTVYKYFSSINYETKNAPKRLAMTIDDYPYSYMIGAFYVGKSADQMKNAIRNAWTETSWKQLLGEVGN